MSTTLLAIETATNVCSVALAFDGAVHVTLTLTRPRAHAENLVPMIREALRLGDVAPAALDAVAVSAGPGSYTGLRIGVSTAKGLAMATDAQLVAIPSLEALAASVAPMAETRDAICTLFNSRRDEVYAALFERADGGAITTTRKPTALSLSDLPNWLMVYSGERCWLVGEGVSRALPVLQEHLSYTFLPLPASAAAPSASLIAECAFARLEAGATEDVAGFEPFYLKAFVAKKPQRTLFEKLPF